MKDVELKLISELVKNSRRSDRELSKTIGVSQPTVSRIRMRFEKEEMIDYGGFPNLAKLGYGLVAVVLGKRNYQKHPETIIQKARDFVQQHPNIIFAADGRGLGYDEISISVHKSFSDYNQFMHELKAEAGETMDVDSFLISLDQEGIVQPLSLKPFAAQLIKK